MENLLHISCSVVFLIIVLLCILMNKYIVRFCKFVKTYKCKYRDVTTFSCEYRDGALLLCFICKEYDDNNYHFNFIDIPFDIKDADEMADFVIHEINIFNFKPYRFVRQNYLFEVYHGKPFAITKQEAETICNKISNMFSEEQDEA